MQFETREDSMGWQRDDRRVLRKGRAPERSAARTLRRCHNGAACRKEHCRQCMRDFRIQWIGEGAKIMIQRATWTRISIIPAGMLVPLGTLKNFDLKAEVKKIRKRLQRCEELRGRVTIGGFDVSLNLFDNVIVGWQLHLFLLVEGHANKALRQAIKKIFPPEPTALFPYDFSEITDHLEVLGYACKAVFKRRSAWQNKDGKKLSRATPLKGPERRELLTFLAQYKVGARLILVGVRRNGQRLVFTKPSVPPG